MSAAASARLLVSGTAWRITGLDAAGRRLVAAAGHGAEDEQTLAGILLVRAGDKSVPLVAEALTAVAASPALIDVLASIGTHAARAALRRATQAPSRELAEAAEAALQTLEKRGGGD